jgi:hypothetical protein
MTGGTSPRTTAGTPAGMNEKNVSLCMRQLHGILLPCLRPPRNHTTVNQSGLFTHIVQWRFRANFWREFINPKNFVLLIFKRGRAGGPLILAGQGDPELSRAVSATETSGQVDAYQAPFGHMHQVLSRPLT